MNFTPKPEESQIDCPNKECAEKAVQKISIYSGTYEVECPSCGYHKKSTLEELAQAGSDVLSELKKRLRKIGILK